MLNLTRQERFVIKFLIAFFLIGGLIHIVKTNWMQVGEKDQAEISAEEKRFKEMAVQVDSLYNVQLKVKTEKFSSNVDHAKIEVWKGIELININTASKEELMSLPKIGEVTAERIILYRMENGDFKDIDQLLEVKGIGKKILELIRGKVKFE